MELNFQSPGMFIIGGILCAAVCAAAFFLRRKPDRGRALKAANTKRLKMSPLYQRRLMEVRILRFLSVLAIIIAFLAGVQELVEAFSGTVSGLDGDRVGISIFNTSSIQYVPMTDDYSFVLQRLDSLSEYLAAAEEFSVNYASKYDSVYDIPEAERPRYEQLNRIMAAFDEGITAGYEIKGTSAIGEGLASCLFSFPELADEERTRIIIFVVIILVPKRLLPMRGPVSIDFFSQLFIIVPCRFLCDQDIL